MEEENKNLEAEEPTEVLGNTGVIEPVVETPTEQVVETPAEPVIETPAPEQAPVEETPVVAETPAVEAAPAQEVPTVPVQAPPVEQPTVEPAAPAPTPEGPKKEEKKGSNKLLIIVALLVLVLGGGYAVWAFVLGGNTPKTEPKKEEEQKEEEKKPEEEEKSEQLTEEQVKEIYNRYHSKPDENGFVPNGSMTFEGMYAYKNESFNVSEMKVMTNNLADYIYNNIKEEIKDKAKPYMPEGGLAKESIYYDVEDIESLVKREFKKLFGNNIEYNIDLFSGCHPLTTLYDNEKKTFKIPVGCGDTVSRNFKFEISSYEEKDDKLIITEKMNTRLRATPDTIESESTYKWTYTKYEDTYVLSTIELVKE